ncbi:MAG: endonuclease/exonuclease/phosphatase family protein [Spirochaetaceae bacterium]|jgi:endonuclease/exonuclease/phosphatase family metal-dependent hydrolase|nr:endonuclease/exonuclease/phosphatase family protein [Spirochaetaceae bacterium]
MIDGGIKHLMNRVFQGIRLILGICCLYGCDAFQELDSGSTPADKTENLTILTWNIQALFDGVEEGNEYDEYLTKTGWSDEKYQARLTVIAREIDRITDGPPDIIGFQEVENGEIVRMLAEELSKHGYNWTFFARNSGASLGIGVLSRFPLTKTIAHSIFNNSEAAPRPVLELWMNPGDRDLVLFVCHWKSKLGGDDATEDLRRASARVLMRRIREIEEEKPETPVIIMGDLNENHDEFYRRAGRVISALLPDDPKAAELAASAGNSAGTGGGYRQDFLLISRQKPPVTEYFDSETEIFYSPWGNELQQGSYNYKNEWETIDHFLLSSELFDQQGWDFHSGRVINQEPFISAYGLPNAYNPRTGNGLSDHLPLVLKLVRH